MALITSHVLDSIRGASAVGVSVTLTRIDADGLRTPMFSCQTDSEGRVSETVDVVNPAESTYELSFQTAAYFRNKQDQADQDQVMEGVVIQIRMTDPDKRYHFPIMASPHSYSLWWSS